METVDRNWKPKNPTYPVVKHVNHEGCNAAQDTQMFLFQQLRPHSANTMTIHRLLALYVPYGASASGLADRYLETCYRRAVSSAARSVMYDATLASIGST